MARAKPNLFSAVSGVAGGVEFAMAKEGMVIKRRRPKRPFDSPAQINAMTSFYRRVADWQAMTPEAMIEWTAFANTHPVTNRLGNVIYLSGYNWFMKLRDTEDGILLPLGWTPTHRYGSVEIIEDGPWNIEILWPAGAADDWTISFYFDEPNLWDFEPPSRYLVFAGTYRKDLLPLDLHDLFYARGIRLILDHTYVIRSYLKAPRYFDSSQVSTFFTVIDVPQWVWHLTMDDNAPDTHVDDDFGNYDQVFEGTNPNTEDHHVEGVHDGALHFDGSLDRIILAEASYQYYMSTDQPFTLCIWWKPDTPVGAGYRDFLSNYATFSPGIQFAIKATESKIFLSFLYGGSRHETACTWVESDVSIWQHWAVVRSGTNVRTFKNGIINLNATDAGFRGVPYVDGTALSIGCQRGVTSYAKGAADDVYLFNRALSDAEVAALAVP